MRKKLIIITLLLMFSGFGKLMAIEMSSKDLGFSDESEFKTFTKRLGELESFWYFYSYCETVSKFNGNTGGMKELAKKLVEANKDFANKLDAVAVVIKDTSKTFFNEAKKTGVREGNLFAIRDLQLAQPNKQEVINNVRTANGEEPHDFEFEGLEAFRKKYQFIINNFSKIQNE